MAFTLDRKVIAITGAGRGIGREIALLCARHGASIVVNDFGVTVDGEHPDVGPAYTVVREIESAGGRATANLASVAEAAGAKSIIDDAMNAFGRLDAVVNNAGILRDRMFHKMSEPEWRGVIETHLNGAFFVARAAAPIFKAQGHGAYVHFTSTSGLIGNVGQANYSAAKMAIVGLSNSIAIDMARFSVRSNCIAPAAWSRMIGTLPTDTEAEKRRVATLQSMTPAQVAPLAAFLCSDHAKEVTGQVFAVRKNEIFLFSVPRPIRSIHRSDGWTPATLASDLLPALKPSFHPLQCTADIFAWDPV